MKPSGRARSMFLVLGLRTQILNRCLWITFPVDKYVNKIDRLSYLSKLSVLRINGIVVSFNEDFFLLSGSLLVFYADYQ